jgi:hypothetical protein
VTDDEESTKEPAPLPQEEPSEKGIKETDLEQMREEIQEVEPLRENPVRKEQQPLIYDEDLTVDEEYPTYAQDSQEYMHWHYRLNHPTQTVMTKMAKQKMLPKRITKILTTMSKQHVKPPMCNNCCGSKATRRPWKGKGESRNLRSLKAATKPGDVVSVDQLE